MAQIITYETLEHTIRDLDWGTRYTMTVDIHEAEQTWHIIQSRGYHNCGPVMDASQEIVDNCVKIDFRIATTEEYLD